MNKRTIMMLALTILLISGFASAQDERLPLNPPPGYYGSITVNGQPAAAGTTIIAMIGGEERGSITTAKSGLYGDDPGPAKLWIRSYQNEPGSTVTFYVSGVAAQQTAKVSEAGATNRADLTFVGVPVPAGTTGSSTVGSSSSGGSGGGSSSGSESAGSSSGEQKAGSSKGAESQTPGVTQSEIPPRATEALNASGALPTVAPAINPTIIIGAVILLVAMLIAVPFFRKK